MSSNAGQDDDPVPLAWCYIHLRHIKRGLLLVLKVPQAQAWSRLQCNTSADVGTYVWLWWHVVLCVLRCAQPVHHSRHLIRGQLLAHEGDTGGNVPLRFAPLGLLKRLQHAHGSGGGQALSSSLLARSGETLQAANTHSMRLQAC